MRVGGRSFYREFRVAGIAWRRTIWADPMGRIGIASLAASALLAVTACGGGASDQADRVEPEAWAADVCTAVNQFVGFTESRLTEFTGEASAARSLKRLKTLAVALYRDFLDQTDVMLRKIDAAGTPEGDQGEEIRREFRAAIGETRAIVVELLAKARDLPTRDLNEFVSQARALRAGAEREFTRWGNSFEDKLGRFKGTFEGEQPEECRRVEATSSG